MIITTYEEHDTKAVKEAVWHNISHTIRNMFIKNDIEKHDIIGIKIRVEVLKDKGEWRWKWQ